MSDYTYQHDPSISGADFEGEDRQPPDLDFDKYKEPLLRLGAEHILEHVKYWRERALKTEHAARLVIEEWHSFGFSSDNLIEFIDELARLIDEDEPK